MALNNRYRITEEGRRRHGGVCLICGLASMDGQPNWKQSCLKCYWKVREKEQDNKRVWHLEIIIVIDIRINQQLIL